ncbi:hypothetical protein ACS0TY_032257 [Phlomoides rotata]
MTMKGKLNPLADRKIQDKKMSKRGELEELNIYVEVDKVKNPDALKNVFKRQSVARRSSSYLPNASDSKSDTKNLEKGKGKPDKSMSSNVGRKVLADIGNRNNSFSKTEQGKTSRTGKGKIEMMLYPQRKGKSERKLHPEISAVDLGKREASLSSRESVKLDSIGATDDNQASKKFVSKNIKVTSLEPRIKLQGRSSIMATTTGRKSVRNPLHTRKSLPVLKQVSQVVTNGMEKEKSEKSDNSRGKHGFPVKPSVRKSIVPKPSNLSSRPWGNRVSDGFVVMSSRAKTKMDAGVISRKSVKPTVQTINTALNTQRNSRSSHVLTTMNLRSRHVDLSKRKLDKASVSKNVPSVESQDEPILATKNLRSRHVDLSKKKQDKSSVSKNVPSVESQDETVPEEVPEEDVSTVAIPRRNSDRRNSFISSLMSRSKLLKDRSKAMSSEPLPNIYDDRNPLEVCDYVDDIYQYYWVMEAHNPLLKNYMATSRDITPQMRGILINWLIEVHIKFDLMEETLFLTVTLLDRYLSLENIKKNEMQLVGLTALLLASKYEDFWHPRVIDLISISAESYTRDQVLTMEKTILKKLKFRLNEPTPYVFMLRFLKAAQSDKKFSRLAFYLIELCLVEYETLNYKPSMLCASAIYVARCTMGLTPPWTPLLAKHTRYEESQLRGCAEMILKFHKAAKTSLLKVTCEKYANPELSRVATIKPLDRLPVS